MKLVATAKQLLFCVLLLSFFTKITHGQENFVRQQAVIAALQSNLPTQRTDCPSQEQLRDLVIHLNKDALKAAHAAVTQNSDWKNIVWRMYSPKEKFLPDNTQTRLSKDKEKRSFFPNKYKSGIASALSNYNRALNKKKKPQSYKTLDLLLTLLNAPEPTPAPAPAAEHKLKALSPLLMSTLTPSLSPPLIDTHSDTQSPPPLIPSHEDPPEETSAERPLPSASLTQTPPDSPRSDSPSYTRDATRSPQLLPSQIIQVPLLSEDKKTFLSKENLTIIGGGIGLVTGLAWLIGALARKNGIRLLKRFITNTDESLRKIERVRPWTREDKQASSQGAQVISASALALLSAITLGIGQYSKS